jgi:transcriptional regulator of nitric oxide reductase
MKKWLVSLLRWSLLSLMLCTQVNAITLKKSDVETYLANKYIVGDINPDVPVWPLFVRDAADENQKPVLFGYAFESVDFEPVRGYGGKPINILVCIDTKGSFIEVRLLDHREPLFRSEAGIAKLSGFAAQYTGLSIHHDIQIYDFKAKTARDDKYAALHGVQAGTVSVRAIDRTIIQSATSVARAHVEAAKNGTIVGEGNAIALSKGSLYDAPVKPLSWAQMQGRGMIEAMSLTRGEIEKAFAGTKAAGADKQAANQPGEVAIKFHVALISVPSIGRNLLDDEGWRLVGANRRDGQALMISESGPLSKVLYESQRIADDIPFVLQQDGKAIKLRSMAYDKGLKVPGYPTATRAHFLIVDTATPLNPSKPFDLSFKLGRRFGSFPNQFTYVEFPLPYAFHGWRASVSALLDSEWVDIWSKRWIDIAVLLSGLVILSVALIRQRATSANASRLSVFRIAYLLFTLIVIGWMFQGQLSIVNITASLDAIATGNDLSFLLTDPMTVILWIFVAITLLVWGRGTFCGWLCPFGAFQELVSIVTQKLGVKPRRFRSADDAKLKWIKYVVLAAVISSIWVLPNSTELAIEVEPFKTAISLYFVRDWPYVIWAVSLLVLSIFVYRGYCRYICPLGAALAVLNPLRRWGWIARREECGTPCQTCRHRCEYQAISPVGKVDYSECFQCLDCVSIYQDDSHCLPLIQERKRGSTMIPIQSIARQL